MYIDLTVWQLILLAYLSIFSYFAIGALFTFVIYFYIFRGNLETAGQVHLLLFWPWHIIVMPIAVIKHYLLNTNEETKD